MGRCRDKLRSTRGIGLIFVVLLVAIAAVALSILQLGYQQHLKNERRFYDENTVLTAERVARETYILDMKSGGITYYYDAVKRTVTDASTFKEKVDIPGYGRCSEAENKNCETGAVGIPNTGGENGAQLLAVSVETDGTIHSRWQGQHLTLYDYKLMTWPEKKRLNIYQLNQIDSQLLYELSKAPSETESEEMIDVSTGKEGASVADDNNMQINSETE